MSGLRIWTVEWTLASGRRYRDEVAFGYVGETDERARSGLDAWIAAEPASEIVIISGPRPWSPERADDAGPEPD